jgi:transposase/DNA replication protein DnaC
MRKVAEVLRLHFELGWSQRQIARSSCLSTSTVHEYVLRFQAAGLGWPLPAGWGEAELVAALHPVSAPAARPPSRAQPEFARVQAEMQASKHTTLQLLWEEYRAAEPAGYTYSRYCHLYRRWLKQGELVLRQNHRPGEKLFTDWAGATIPIYDPATGDADPASIFVAVLGASNYTWAEAFINQTLTSWLAGHVHAFEFFGGVPEMVVPDNPRTAVTRAHRYEPDLNPSYQQMALHYGVGVLPARPYKPRDKAKVESGVLVVERWIVAALRHRRFHSLAELNLAIRELLDRLNQRPFKKRPGSRASLFAELDQPALRPLPAQPFELAEWRMATVNIDYHIQFDHAFYSVPYHLARQKVEVRATAETIEIFHRGQRVQVAKLRANTCVEDIDFRASRGLDRNLVRSLTNDSGWVRRHENLFITGPTGVGKSYLACALAHKACRDGYSAFYIRAQALFRDLALARADGSLRGLLARLARVDVLVVDDWAMAPLDEQERRAFWEICEDRYQLRSTLLTSQLPVADWHCHIGEPTVADGILDRLVHNAHRVELRGDSLRKNKPPRPDSGDKA